MGQAMLGLCETARSLRDGTLDVMRLLAMLEDRMQAREPDVLAMLPEAGRFARLAREARELCSRYPDVGARPPLFNPSPTRNPRNPAHTPGGSSSGSAAAVAAGYGPLGIGTQTVGSVVRPASYCGVTGFKPSLGRISTQGIIPFSQSVDQVGFFTSDAAGADLGDLVDASPRRIAALERAEDRLRARFGAAALMTGRGLASARADAGPGARPEPSNSAGRRPAPHRDD